MKENLGVKKPLYNEPNLPVPCRPKSSNQFLAWLARVFALHLVQWQVQSKDSLIEAELLKKQ